MFPLACRFILQAIHALVSSLLYKLDKYTCWPKWTWSWADSCYICGGINRFTEYIPYVMYMNFCIPLMSWWCVVFFQVLIHNVMRIASSTDIETQQAHEFSIYLVLPFLTISLALLAFNWYGPWETHWICSNQSFIYLFFSLEKNHDTYASGILQLFLLVIPTPILLEWLWLW